MKCSQSLIFALEGLISKLTMILSVFFYWNRWHEISRVGMSGILFWAGEPGREMHRDANIPSWHSADPELSTRKCQNMTIDLCRWEDLISGKPATFLDWTPGQPNGLHYQVGFKLIAQLSLFFGILSVNREVQRHSRAIGKLILFTYLLLGSTKVFLTVKV